MDDVQAFLDAAYDDYRAELKAAMTAHDYERAGVLRGRLADIDAYVDSMSEMARAA